jgi:predicted DNA-binding transcriptional regulator AlpA
VPPALITRARAAQILGVSTKTVDRLIEQGHLVPRAEPPRGGKPSLDPADVRVVAERRAAEQVEAEQLRRERQARRVMPPDDDHEWLTASQVARRLAITDQAVFKRTRNDTLPFSVSSGRRWYRADHVEVVARSRRARRSRKVEPVGP